MHYTEAVYQSEKKNKNPKHKENINGFIFILDNPSPKFMVLRVAKSACYMQKKADTKKNPNNSDGSIGVTVEAACVCLQEQ